jgi:hypothetical protein
MEWLVPELSRLQRFGLILEVYWKSTVVSPGLRCKEAAWIMPSLALSNLDLACRAVGGDKRENLGNLGANQIAN